MHSPWGVIARGVMLVPLAHLVPLPRLGLPSSPSPVLSRRGGFEGAFDTRFLKVPRSRYRGEALLVQQIAKEQGKITLFTGPATTRLTNEDCSPTGFHWAFDTYSQAVGTARAVVPVALCPISGHSADVGTI